MRKATKRGEKRGFTAVEVMMALTLLAVGTAGVIAMEQSAIGGNFDARRLDVATSVLRLWTERLRNDGAMWTLPNAKNPTTYNLATAAPLLANAATDPTAAVWTLPVAREGDTLPLMPQLDLLGRDVLSSDTSSSTSVKPDALACRLMAPGSSGSP
ncbi:MAG: prepilin-type N-terminal cleavage/methylation domain-containing protein [Polyangiaceae bacterium]